MTYTNIVLKNLKYNMTKFTSYIFVNMFVVSILFTYGSIVFNKNITEDPILSSTMDFVYMGIIAILLFSIIFISYTGIYFIKTRGRELGVYLTLGMTKKDLTKMILLESTVIMLISVLAGILARLIFSGLFYLVLGNILDTNNLFYLDKNSFLLSLGVFLLVFLSNIVFSIIFIKRTNITSITKATKTKGMKMPKKISGFLGIVIFIVSTTMLYLVFTDNSLVDSLSDEATKVIFINVTLQFISLYFLVASGLSYIITLLSKNKKFYNNHILILSNLRYSFYTYKTTLYVISLLTGMSILFMGIQLSFKIGTTKIMNDVLPYDFMIESQEGYNNISVDEIYALVEKNGGTVEEFVELPYISTEIYRENSEWLFNYGITTMVISESDFNKAFGTDIDVSYDELLMVHNADTSFGETNIDYDTCLVIDNYDSGEKRAEEVRYVRPSREEFFEILQRDNVEYLGYNQEKTTSMFYSFINSQGEMEFASVLGNVIDDEAYNSLKNTEKTTAYMFNVKSADDEVLYSDIISTLNDKNKDKVVPTDTYTKSLKPICKSIKMEMTEKMLSMFSFTMTFISMLFLISSSVVLYYKLVNDVDYEIEQIDLFKKVGVNRKEAISYLSYHTGLIFFLPMILGGGVGIFYNYFFFYSIPQRNYLLMVVLIMYLCFVVYDVIFYFILRASLVKKVFKGK